jgi:phospholipase D1/2
LIVDDRVAIIGSANINDRSMLGDRDSEVAIRFEDTEMIDIALGRERYSAGKTIFDFRMRLMSQHVGCSPETGRRMIKVSQGMTVNCIILVLGALVDVLNSEIFDQYWHDIASMNTWVHDRLDGETSVYKCESLAQYRSAISTYKNPSMDHPTTIDLVSRLRGFLVHWPLRFLAKEDLSPPLAIRAVLPNQLWV